MNSNSPDIVLGFRASHLRLRSAGVAIALGLLTSHQAIAQPTPSSPATPQQLAKYDQNKNGVLDSAERDAMQSDEARAAAVDPNSTEAGARDVVQLSPFAVEAEKDDGFAAVNAGTATKLGVDLKDLAAPYSVMTGEFIKAVGITNIQEAANWSTNGSPVIDAQGADLFLAPSMYNIRGVVINAGQQRNFFLTASIGDTYNAERIDFGRGPNAVLFNVGANDVLGGGISTQGKRARTDRDFETISATIGSWDNYRSTVDINKRVTDKIALRANAVWQDKKGYLQDEMAKIKGITIAGTYDIAKKTQLRFEILHDKIQRANPAGPYFDNFSGWNGTTIFDGPLTNNQLSATATPGAPNTFGQTLTFDGSPQGVWRENNPTYIYDPTTGSVINYIHEARTRRGDENNRVPIYSGGQVWTRNGSAELLPFGNWGRQQRPAQPGVFENSSQVPLLYADDLPGDRFDRQIANSNFRLPGKRFSVTPNDAPLLTERTKGAQLGFTHQIAERLFFELNGDVNEVHDDVIFSNLGFRFGFIDINTKLPDGRLNPHFLDAYSQSDMVYRERWTKNAGVRANLAYIQDLGKWGHYTFTLNGGATERRFKSRFRRMSMALAADPREWQGQPLILRYYWNEAAHPFTSIAPTNLVQRTVVPGTGGADNTYTMTTQAIRPRWVLNDWWNEGQKTKIGTLAMAAKWFDGKVVFTGGVRYDDVDSWLRNPAVRFGGLPVNPNWDGISLDDRYFKPDAPADWKTLTYIPKNPDGSPRSAVPLPAIDRPTVTGANGVNPFAPQYANDRFRNDYNPPAVNSQGVTTTYGIMYHALRWASVHANYGESYKPLGVNTWLLDFSQAEPEKGIAYDYGVTLDLLKNRLAIKASYYFNRNENRLGRHSTIDSVNNLLRRQPITDASLEGRNHLGFSDVFGNDYFARKNEGYEVEITGRIARGWRITANYGSGRVDDYDRWPGTQAYVQSRKSELEQVLVAAGGMLDTTQKPPNAPSAPGRAIVNPNVTHLRGATYQQDAVNDYNNIWINYDQIPTLVDFIGQKRAKINVFTDYSFHEGRLKGLRVGIGAQYSDPVIAGYKSGDTIANPNYNPNAPVTATNRPWADDPSVDGNTPVYIKQPFDVTATIGYSRRLKSGFRLLEGKEIEFQLVIRNLLNSQKVINQDEGVALRPPNGDFSVPYRQSVPGRIGLFQRPINFEFTTTIKL
jgi:hypothetical protein